MRMVECYYSPKGSNGSFKYLMPDIDAADAIRRFPDEYSYEPAGGRQIVDRTQTSGAALPDEKQEFAPGAETAPAEQTAPAPDAPAATAKAKS